MHAPLSILEQSVWPYISTGHLPESGMVQKPVSEADERFKSHTEGQNSRICPALARVPRDLFGICVVGTGGSIYAAGEVDCEFSIMSVSKPFVFTPVCQAIGPEEVRDSLGVRTTPPRAKWRMP